MHVRRRLTANFTILSNRLAQRPGSAVTVGVGAYLMSVPDGVPVSIDALRAHFTEGETRLARALNDLEAEGFLERVTVRVANGQVRTRTYVYDVPATATAHAQAADQARPVPHSAPQPHASGRPEPAPQSESESEPEPEPEREPAAEPEQQSAPQRVSEPQPQTARRPAPSVASDAPAFPPAHVPAPEAAPVPAPTPVPEPVPEAVAVLAALRLRDPRLLLSERDVCRLAPAVGEWLRRGVGPERIVEAVCADLPGPVVRRPAGLIAYRLGHLKPVESAPLPSPQGRRPNVVPMQNCDACDRGYRAEHPGLCRDCVTVSAAA
ncbi:hypothetical protein [Actinacidiphila soli]|uniref:hypothetical protein n=1 Tax=Actinacidiphila soli TaxID=2487275 RepID=UPI0013E39C02|nr:hypothetical protein [Actinacidiphila soli]